MSPNVVATRVCRLLAAAWLVSVTCVACDDSEQAPQPSAAAAGTGYPGGRAGATSVTAPHEGVFHPPPLEDGYQRFETEPIEVPAGASDDWAQWVGGPLDQDYDVIDIRGDQSLTGHHALMYAAQEAQEPGFTRLWQDADNLTTRLMGGVGGEGGANVKLPPGIVFRVKKGSYLMVQTHYLNATDRTITARSVLDVKLAPTDPSRKLASIMSATSLAINLPPQVESTMDITCHVKKDLEFIQVSNHMHDYGVTMTTEFTDPDGVRHTLKDDPKWTGDMALNPNFSHFPPESPKRVPAGSILHARCAWNNTSTKIVTFPAEMCVFFGFVLHDADIYCTDDNWSTQDAADSGSAP